MAIKKPIVIYNGLLKQIQSGDITTGESSAAISKSVEGGASGICLFNYEAMTSRHWKALKECLGR